MLGHVEYSRAEGDRDAWSIRGSSGSCPPVAVGARRVQRRPRKEPAKSCCLCYHLRCEEHRLPPAGSPKASRRRLSFGRNQRGLPSHTMHGRINLIVCYMSVRGPLHPSFLASQHSRSRSPAIVGRTPRTGLRIYGCRNPQFKARYVGVPRSEVFVAWHAGCQHSGPTTHPQSSLAFGATRLTEELRGSRQRGS